MADSDIKNMQQQVNSLADAFKSRVAEVTGQHVVSVKADIDPLIAKLDRARKSLEEIGETAKVTSTISTTAAGRMTTAFGKLGSQLTSMTIGLTTGQLMMSRVLSGTLDSLNFMDLQLRATKKSTLDMGYTWGDTADLLDSKWGMMDRNFRQLSTDLMMDLGQVKVAAGEMRDAFTMDEIMGRTGDSFKVAEENVGALAATMYIARASGMDHGSIMKDMAMLHYDFGKSVKDSEIALAHMIITSDKANMSTRSYVPIVSSIAQQYRVFGTDITKVADNMLVFAEQMQDNKGIVGDVFKAYMSGLQGMQFGNRAFLSLFAGPGSPMAGMGPIIGGLQLEETLASGNISDVTQLITNMLGQYGGKIQERGAAIAGGGDASVKHLLQRTLLMNQLSMDVGTAEQMMSILSELQNPTDKTAEESLKKLEDLLNQGKEYGVETTALLSKIDIALKATVAGGLLDIYGAIANDLAPALSVFGIDTSKLGAPGSREFTVNVVTAITDKLAKAIPGAISSFLDSFNENIGDLGLLGAFLSIPGDVFGALATQGKKLEGHWAILGTIASGLAGTFNWMKDTIQAAVSVFQIDPATAKFIQKAGVPMPTLFGTLGRAATKGISQLGKGTKYEKEFNEAGANIGDFISGIPAFFEKMFNILEKFWEVMTGEGTWVNKIKEMFFDIGGSIYHGFLSAYASQVKGSKMAAYGFKALTSQSPEKYLETTHISKSSPYYEPGDTSFRKTDRDGSGRTPQEITINVKLVDNEIRTLAHTEVEFMISKGEIIKLQRAGPRPNNI